MKEIPLTQGQVALVDDEDYQNLSRFNWCATWNGSSWYAVRHLRTIHVVRDGRRVKREINRYLHHEIMGKRRGFDVDHKNRNTLDCRRDNLRWGTRSQNLTNRLTVNRTGFRGVSKQSRHESFMAKISIRNRSVHLGNFPTAIQAAAAYNAAAVKQFGEFAVLNKIGG